MPVQNKRLADWDKAGGSFKTSLKKRRLLPALYPYMRAEGVEGIQPMALVYVFVAVVLPLLWLRSIADNLIMGGAPGTPTAFIPTIQWDVPASVTPVGMALETALDGSPMPWLTGVPCEGCGVVENTVLTPFLPAMLSGRRITTSPGRFTPTPRPAPSPVVAIHMQTPLIVGGGVPLYSPPSVVIIPSVGLTPFQFPTMIVPTQGATNVYTLVPSVTPSAILSIAAPTETGTPTLVSTETSSPTVTASETSTSTTTPTPSPSPTQTETSTPSPTNEATSEPTLEAVQGG